MILQMVIGAGLAIWSFIGIALIGWMIHAFIKDRDRFWSVAWAMLE